jgi:8-oxo-dGTP diphosphatase
MMARYTLCFIRRGEYLLMLNRKTVPCQGLWTGVGGKIEPGELPLESVLREADEETGIKLEDARFSGLVTFNGKYKMYVYISTLSVDAEYPTPRRCDEGLLDWKELSWVLAQMNAGVPTSVRHYLPQMLQEESLARRHDFVFQDVFTETGLVEYQVVDLDNEG